MLRCWQFAIERKYVSASEVSQSRARTQTKTVHEQELRTMKHLLSVLGYIVATFVIQALSHFVLFKSHYASVSWIKAEPIFALGFASMIIQGLVMSIVYERSRFSAEGLIGAVKLAGAFGLVLVSYIAFAEAAKYAVPSVAAWIGIETLAGIFQFALAGLLMFYAHKYAK